jgi:hypothetical protein
MLPLLYLNKRHSPVATTAALHLASLIWCCLTYCCHHFT